MSDLYEIAQHHRIRVLERDVSDEIVQAFDRIAQLETELEQVRAELNQVFVAGSDMVIKPCPFCGSSDVDTGHGSSFYVHCNNCDTDGPWNDECEQLAIAAWNNRPQIVES